MKAMIYFWGVFLLGDILHRWSLAAPLVPEAQIAFEHIVNFRLAIINISFSETVSQMDLSGKHLRFENCSFVELTLVYDERELLPEDPRLLDRLSSWQTERTLYQASCNMTQNQASMSVASQAVVNKVGEVNLPSEPVQFGLDGRQYAPGGVTIAGTTYAWDDVVCLTSEDVRHVNLSLGECWVDHCYNHDPLRTSFVGCRTEPCEVGELTVSYNELNNATVTRPGGYVNVVEMANVSYHFEGDSNATILNTTALLSATTMSELAPGETRSNTVIFRYDDVDRTYNELRENKTVHDYTHFNAWGQRGCFLYTLRIRFDYFGDSYVIGNVTIRYCDLDSCSPPPPPPGIPAPPLPPQPPPTPPPNCYYGPNNGSDYFGYTQYTESGHGCLPWNRSPFTGEDLQYYLLYPWLVDPTHVYYCRNPDGRQRPWCYTSTPGVRWEFCNLLTLPHPSPTAPYAIVKTSITFDYLATQFPNDSIEDFKAEFSGRIAAMAGHPVQAEDLDFTAVSSTSIDTELRVYSEEGLAAYQSLLQCCLAAEFRKSTFFDEYGNARLLGMDTLLLSVPPSTSPPPPSSSTPFYEELWFMGLFGVVVTSLVITLVVILVLRIYYPQYLPHSLGSLLGQPAANGDAELTEVTALSARGENTGDTRSPRGERGGKGNTGTAQPAGTSISANGKRNRQIRRSTVSSPAKENMASAPDYWATQVMLDWKRSSQFVVALEQNKRNNAHDTDTISPRSSPAKQRGQQAVSPIQDSIKKTSTSPKSIAASLRSDKEITPRSADDSDLLDLIDEIKPNEVMNGSMDEHPDDNR
ncbi:hypothetical protein CYMTET_30873 [Cymbomonas tetramitiformis]|uniref:Kringle domain-containing protein n=1 Tax=Cymbomonas tetramitiformis TaxID=36881 RepID=A0AAE0FI93_9CHLO|nr:hypothetical protein CYMTET_30873 [Cymbomonas tetramitiformis]